MNWNNKVAGKMPQSFDEIHAKFEGEKELAQQMGFNNQMLDAIENEYTSEMNNALNHLYNIEKKSDAFKENKEEISNYKEMKEEELAEFKRAIIEARHKNKGLDLLR